MSDLVGIAQLDLDIQATAELELEVDALVYITSDSPINLPEVLIDALDGGEPSDITYTPINANGLVGISGGLP